MATTKTAVRELKPLAAQDDTRAQILLGKMYYTGRGVRQDYGQAAGWLHQAAELGNASAQVKLARLYWDGVGVPKNYTLALRWYRKAAEQGDATGPSLVRQYVPEWVGCHQGLQEGTGLVPTGRDAGRI